MSKTTTTDSVSGVTITTERTDGLQAGKPVLTITTTIVGGEAARPEPAEATEEISAAEQAYRDAIAALRTESQKDGPRPVDAPSSPQLDDGSLNLGPRGAPTTAVHAIPVASGVGHENWVVMDPRYFEGENLQLVQHTFKNGGGNKMTAQEFKDFWQNQQVPDPHNSFYAELEVLYGTIPSAGGFPPVPPGHDIRIFDVFRLEIDNAGVVSKAHAGFLHQDIFPVGSLNRVEHWLLRPNYAFPKGGRLVPPAPGDQSPITVLLERQRPANTPPGGAGETGVAQVETRSVADLINGFGTGSFAQVRAVGSTNIAYTWQKLIP